MTVSSPYPGTLTVAVPQPSTSTTTTATSTDVAVPPTSSSAAGSPWLTAALLAAALTAAVTGLLARRKHLEDERARLTNNFSEASKAVAAYMEMPYAIRRRNHDEPANERVRLSEKMAKTQADLSFYLAWTAAESAEVGIKYDNLVSQLRQVAGSACHDAWLDPAPTLDSDMNIPPTVIDLSPLQPFQGAYVMAAQTHLDRYLSWRSIWRRPKRL